MVNPPRMAFWSLLEDGNGQLFARRYNVTTDEYDTLPFPDRDAAEAHIRATSFKVIARYDEWGDEVEAV